MLPPAARSDTRDGEGARRPPGFENRHPGPPPGRTAREEIAHTRRHTEQGVRLSGSGSDRAGPSGRPHDRGRDRERPRASNVRPDMHASERSFRRVLAAVHGPAREAARPVDRVAAPEAACPAPQGMAPTVTPLPVRSQTSEMVRSVERDRVPVPERPMAPEGQWVQGSEIQPRVGRVVSYGGQQPRTEVVIFDWSLAGVVTPRPRPPQEYEGFVLEFPPGPWGFKDRGTYQEQLKIRLHPQLPFLRPRQVASGGLWPVISNGVTMYCPEVRTYDYYVAGAKRQVIPPKLAPNAARFLAGVADDWMLSHPPLPQVDWMLVPAVMLAMGEEYMRVHHCGAVDKRVASLIFTVPAYMAAFLAMWPDGSWDRLSLIGRRDPGPPQQWAFEEELIAYPGCHEDRATSRGEAAYAAALRRR
eukprot:jgi/Mesvir1/19860/Mv13150-RA.1